MVVVGNRRDERRTDCRFLEEVPSSASEFSLCCCTGVCGVVFWCCNASALINFVAYLKQQTLRNVPFPDVLFLSHYPGSVRGNWLASSILTILLVFATGYVF